MMEIKDIKECIKTMQENDQYNSMFNKSKRMIENDHNPRRAGTASLCADNIIGYLREAYRCTNSYN